MEGIDTFNKEVPITSSQQTFSQTSLSDISKYVAMGGFVYHGGFHDLPRRSMDGFDGMTTLIPHSIVTSRRPAHGGIDSMDRITHTYIPTVIGNQRFYRTSNTIVAFDNGDGANLPHWEECDERTYAWRAVTEVNNAVSYTKLHKFKSLTVAKLARLEDALLNKLVTDIAEYNGDWNELGKYLSMAETLRQDLRNYEIGREAVVSREDIEYLGVTSIDGIIKCIDRLPNGRIRLSTGTKAYGHISDIARRYGVSFEAIKNAVLGEEVMHNLRRDYDRRGLSIDFLRIRMEKATKQALLAHYMKLYNGAEGNERLRKEYKGIIEHVIQDIKTVARYRELYRGNNKDGSKKGEEANEAPQKSDKNVDAKGGKRTLEARVKEDSERRGAVEAEATETQKESGQEGEGVKGEEGKGKGSSAKAEDSAETKGDTDERESNGEGATTTSEVGSD